MLQSVKKKLKDNRFVHTLWSDFRNRHHNVIIEKEQYEYEKRALEMGLSLEEESAQIVFQRLRDRLATRGISWPPDPAGRDLHIVFCTTKSNELEQANIPPELERIVKVTCYYVDRRWKNPNQDRLRERTFVDRDLPVFLEQIAKESPVDIVLSYLSGSSISRDTIIRINDMGIATFLFHQDDRLYFRGRKIGDQWTGPADVCASYDLNLTNCPKSLIKYRVEGGNALFWPSAANRDFCVPRDLPFEYDVSFIGAKYGVRSSLVHYLKSNGIHVECFGPGWKNGRVSDDRMIDIYSKSRINLGISYVGYSSYQCLKGRDFEVPMCGALYLTSMNEDLGRVYRIGEEIAVYTDFQDCLRQIGKLLADPDRCARMRSAVREAGLRRHTREIRVRALLECKASVPDPSADTI
ncbi:hypothetical protein Desti_0029 [Desulfomonile tiedjei DSM 6799]|uniref:Spore protein YkvP/CgeB glycosyl transferase-like domain-containing protein n=2 Tax=Desulfomonile tiedjei TaxID=2358 RepID=I4BZP0_DESTA|nr:hypothetical protein Desti_0029 [Desulfomonile tiedjei DSM 6799]